MRTSLTVGSFARIPIRLHMNWFITVALVTWSLAGGYFPQMHPGWGYLIYWVVGFTTALLFFASVLLHEIGHAVIALREGVVVNSITLFIFGGVAHIDREPDTPGAEFRIVIAGPFTSLVLAALFYVLSWMALPLPALSAASAYLSQINLILAVFNLIPGFPLDGGRVLRAALWRIMGDFSRATRWASNSGVIIALLFVVLGIGLMVLGSFISGLWMAFIGWYLGSAAREGYRQLEENELLPDEAPISPSRLQPVARIHVHSPENIYGRQFALLKVARRREKLDLVKHNQTRLEVDSEFSIGD